MDDQDIFRDSRSKIARARKHLLELQATTAAHIQAHPVKYELSRNTIKTPPALEHAPAIIGDIIHNLRASLDLMASAMARANGKNDKQVYFPFGEDIGGFEQQIKRKNFHFCGEDAVALLKSLKPFRGGNDRLRALHDLDIMDKHRSLIPELTLNVPITMHVPTNRLVQVAGEDHSYSFPPGTILSSGELIQTTKDLVELCEGILEAFAALEVAKQGGADGRNNLG
jgi:hypothetical protein